MEEKSEKVAILKTLSRKSYLYCFIGLQMTKLKKIWHNFMKKWAFLACFSSIFPLSKEEKWMKNKKSSPFEKKQPLKFLKFLRNYEKFWNFWILWKILKIFNIIKNLEIFEKLWKIWKYFEKVWKFRKNLIPRPNANFRKYLTSWTFS